MTTQDREPDEIEALLPWHAAGTLSGDDAARVEAALARDHELARRYALVREELAETIRLNEALGAPSPRPLQRLMTQIDAEAASGARSRAPLAFARRLEGLFVRLSPRTLAWSAVAAAVVILVQAGLLAALFMGPRGQTYRTASVERASAPGSYALVGFVPQASAADVTKFLETYKAAIVDGPRAGGLYRIQVGKAGLSRDELGKVIERMQRESAVVRFAAPTD
jgi:anti-sigma-K factor RskA